MPIYLDNCSAYTVTNKYFEFEFEFEFEFSCHSIMANLI